MNSRNKKMAPIGIRENKEVFVMDNKETNFKKYFFVGFSKAFDFKDNCKVDFNIKDSGTISGAWKRTGEHFFKALKQVIYEQN